ncbi:MAG: hypothetical protein PUC23_02610 [bacterium]|nr:hypothetical protein [bacterium]
MIERYEIKNENNEEVLYIDINFNYEFSKIGLFNDIENLLKKKKIKFSGKKIVITVSGIALATLLLTKPIMNNSNNIKYPDYKYVSSIILNNYDANNKMISSTEYETDNDNAEESKIETPTKEINVKNKNVNNNNINNTNTSSGTTTTNTKNISTSTKTSTPTKNQNENKENT